MTELAQRTGRTVSVNLNQPDRDPEVWRTVLNLLDDAAAADLPLYAQVAGRSIGVLYCLHGSVHPLLFHPAYAEVDHLPMAERLVALAEPHRRHRIVHEFPDDDGLFERAVIGKLTQMWLVDSADIDYEPSATTSVAAEAARQGVPAMALVLDHLMSDGGNGMIYAPFFNYGYGDLSMTFEAMQHPRHAHRALRRGRPLRRHLRRRHAHVHAHPLARNGDAAPPCRSSRWSTSRRARPPALGLHDRGLVAPGMRADLNVIDFDALSFGLPRMAFDLPAGGRRLVQRARGLRRHVRRRRAHYRRRRVHRRTPRSARARPAAPPSA